MVMKPSCGVIARDRNTLEGFLFLFLWITSCQTAPRNSVLSGSRFIKVLEEPRPTTHSETKYLFVNSIALQRLNSLTFVNTEFTSDFTLPRNISKAKELRDSLKKTKNKKPQTKPNQTTDRARLRWSGQGRLPGEVSPVCCPEHPSLQHALQVNSFPPPPLGTGERPCKPLLPRAGMSRPVPLLCTVGS